MGRGEASENSYFDVRCYFFAYLDGCDLPANKANWPSLNEAISQFRKYTSLSDLRAALGQNAHCVGLYVECRTNKPVYGYIDNGAQHSINVPMKIKDDAPAKTYGYVRYSQRLYSDPAILNSNWTFPNYSSYANLPWASYIAYNYRDAVQIGYDVNKLRSTNTDFWCSIFY